MFIKIYPQNPQERLVIQAVNTLRQGGIAIYPTDSVYGMGCSIEHLNRVSDIERIKGYYTPSSSLSFLCYDLSQLSSYCKPIGNSVFRLMKKNLPGPFTFLLEANSQVPKLFKGKKKKVGIRVPDNPILQLILRELNGPIISTSLPWEDQEPEYTYEHEFNKERFDNIVEIIIDGGTGGTVPSAIIDCTGSEPEVIREGPLPLIVN